MKLNLPRIVWLRWAGPEKDFDRLLIVGARNNQEARRMVIDDGNLLEGTLQDISEEVGTVWYGAYPYIEYDQSHWDEEDGVPAVDRWDVIVIGPEDQVFWQLITGAFMDAALEIQYAYNSRSPNFEVVSPSKELGVWFVDNPADARKFLKWAREAWGRENSYVNSITGDPSWYSLIEVGELEPSVFLAKIRIKEGGHGRAL